MGPRLSRRRKQVRNTVTSFLDYLTSERGLSGNTVAAYSNDLVQLLDFLEESAGLTIAIADWESVDQQVLTRYVIELQERGYSPTTRARKIAAVKSFFNFLIEEGLVSEDPTEAIASPKIGRSLPKSLSEDEMNRLLEAAGSGDSGESRRDAAMIELMYATGMRVSELVGMSIDDLNLRENFVRCMGKGSKERLISLHDEAAVVLEEYLRHVRPQFLQNRRNVDEREDALFLNRRGERLTRQGFWLALKECGRKAGITTPITPHTLRHTFATHMLRGGAPIRYLQELLGHASITTTQVYTHLAQEHVHDEYERSHPRA